MYIFVIAIILIFLLFFFCSNKVEPYTNPIFQNDTKYFDVECGDNNSCHRNIDNEVTIGFDAPLPTEHHYETVFNNVEDNNINDFLQGYGFGGTDNTFNKSFQEIEKQNNLNNINAQLLDDLFFRDVIVYENDYDGRLGLDKCLDNKSGFCVEYGQTGIAYYYPDDLPYDYYGAQLNKSLTMEEKMEPTYGIISYPNLR